TKTMNMNHSISLKQAIDYVTRFRTRKKDLFKPEHVESNVFPSSETFDREAIDNLLSHPKCIKLRIYNGMSEDLNIRMVLVGVDENDQDILPLNENKILNGDDDDDDEPIIVDEGIRCPPVCPPPSPLNP